MSIISSEAKWAVLQRVVRLSIEEIRGTTKGKEYEAGFIAGATRRLTPRSKPWRNGSSGTAANGMASIATRRKTRKTHGITQAASPDGRKTISDKPRNYSHWHGRR